MIHALFLANGNLTPTTSPFETPILDKGFILVYIFHKFSLDLAVGRLYRRLLVNYL